MTVARAVAIAVALVAPACAARERVGTSTDSRTVGANQPYIVVLGTAQDGGYPQAGTKPGEAWQPERRRYATSLAIVDPRARQRWLVEATPDFRDQLHLLDELAPADAIPGIDGILLTHAHVGHYTGLLHLGREIIGARGVPVFAMPRLRAFLTGNGPWSQLVELGNIELRPLAHAQPVQLNEHITVTPLLVPHRDEYSETVGFIIAGPRASVFFLPDIDKWERWDERGTRIEDVIGRVDVAYIDGTFYQDGEVPGRAMSEIPHPFMSETMRRLERMPPREKAKVRFIHLNRTNPAAFAGSPEHRAVQAAGFRIAEVRETIPL